MGKLIAFEWMSLDGVFDADTMPTWWDPYDSSDRQRCIQDVYVHTDAFLMGRATYDMLYPFWSGLPDDAMGGVAGKLNNTPKYVVSCHGGQAPWKGSTVIPGKETLETAIRKLKDDAGETVVIGSATLVRELTRARLIDEYKFLVQPIIAGRGKRLFLDGINVKLRLLHSRELDRGVMFVQFGLA